MILAVLGRGLLPYETPVIRADDDGFLRGEAVFDTARVTVTAAGKAEIDLLDEHLQRLAASAARLGLPTPDTAGLTALAEQAAQAYAVSAPSPEATLRLVWSRGSGDRPLGFVTVIPLPATTSTARSGLTLAALTTGMLTGIYDDAPWLLAGVKSASYAQRMAAAREARTRGCDEVLFVSADGFALDGATSALVWRTGETLQTTDVARGGVLRSQTVEAIARAAAAEGVGLTEDLVTLEDLAASEGAWLVSASRGVVPILAIQSGLPGQPPVSTLAVDHAWTARLAQWAGFPAPPHPQASDIRDLARRAQEHDGVAPLSEAVLLDLDTPRPATTFQTRQLDGALVAVLHHNTAEGSAELVVDPAHRRRGHARKLLDALPPQTRVWAHGDLSEAATTAQALGWEPARLLLRLERSGGTTPALVLPEGFTERGLIPGTPDETDLLRVNAAAFASHPEQGRMDDADLARRMGTAWFEADGVRMIHDATGRLAAFHWTKVHPETPGTGEVYVVGVDPAYQGRGLGRAATVAGLQHLARRGVNTVELYVDGDNAAALATYRRLGFVQAAADRQYRRS